MMRSLLALLLLVTATQAHAADESANAPGVPLSHRFLGSVNLGYENATSSDDSSAMLTIGAGIGFDIGAVGNWARLVPELAYDYTSYDLWFLGAYDISTYTVKVNFRDVLNTGFYFGPTLGLMNVGYVDFFSAKYNRSLSKFTYGIFAGYDIFKDFIVSVAPEAQLIRVENYYLYKFMINLNVHLF